MVPTQQPSSSSQPAAAAAPGRRLAVIVGVSKYTRRRGGDLEWCDVSYTMVPDSGILVHHCIPSLSKQKNDLFFFCVCVGNVDRYNYNNKKNNRTMGNLPQNRVVFDEASVSAQQFRDGDTCFQLKSDNGRRIESTQVTDDRGFFITLSLSLTVYECRAP